MFLVNIHAACILCIVYTAQTTLTRGSIFSIAWTVKHSSLRKHILTVLIPANQRLSSNKTPGDILIFLWAHTHTGDILIYPWPTLYWRYINLSLAHTLTGDILIWLSADSPPDTVFLESSRLCWGRRYYEEIQVGLIGYCRF